MLKIQMVYMYKSALKILKDWITIGKWDLPYFNPAFRRAAISRSANARSL